MFRSLDHTSATPIGPRRPGIARLLVSVLLCAAWVCLFGQGDASSIDRRNDCDLRNAGGSAATPAAVAREPVAGAPGKDGDRLVLASEDEGEFIAERVAESDEDATHPAPPEPWRVTAQREQSSLRRRDPITDRKVARLAPARAPPTACRRVA